MTLFRRAWLALPFLIASVAASAWLIDARMKLDTSLVAFLPQPSEHEQAIRAIARDYRNLEPVMVVIHARAPGQEALLREVARVFAEQWLDDQNYFHRPVYRSDASFESYFQSLPNSRLIELLAPGDWAELRRLVKGRVEHDLAWMTATRLNAFLPRRARVASEKDPLGVLAGIRDRLARSRGPTLLNARDGYFFSEDGTAIALLLYPVLDAENARDADRTLRFLERSAQGMLDRHPAWRDRVRIEFTGSLARTARDARAIRHDFGTIAGFSIGLAMLLLLVVFRKAEAIVFVFLPPLIGATWTLALATLCFGGVTVVTATFLAVAGALGLQISIHLFHRFTLELYRTRHYYRALQRSYVETGRGAFTTALVLAAIFFLLFLTALWGRYDAAGLARVVSDPQGLGQLGLVVGLCILCCLAACLVTLPLLAAIKHAMARGRVKPVPLYRFKLDRVFEPAIQRPQATILTMLLIGALCGFYARKLSFYPRFAAASSFFFHQPAGADATTAGGFPLPGRPLIAVVEGATLEEALQRNDRLYANLRVVGDRYGVLSMDSLRATLPSIRSQRESLAQLAAFDLAAFRSELQAACVRLGLRPMVYETFLAALGKLRQESANPRSIGFSVAEPPELLDAVMRYVTRKDSDDGHVTYYVRTVIYPSAPGFAPAKFPAMRRDLSFKLPDLTLIGDPVVEREMTDRIKANLAVMILAAIATILAALCMHFKKFRLAWLTFVPIVAETLWMCGLMALTGLQIHFFTVLAMPLVLTLAFDNALQLTQYFSDRQPCTVRYAMVSVGRVPALTGGVAALIYGTLGLMSYPGFQDFGQMVVIGAFVTTLGSTMLQPALLQILGKNQPLADALTLGAGEGD
jgi:predicted exporter